MTRLSILIVSYNSAALLGPCLDSLLAQSTPDDEIVVIDNASSDGSVDLVRQSYPAVWVIANSDNNGFGAANNQGINATTGRYVVLVNPDSEVQPGSLNRLCRFLEVHPHAAVAGGRLRYADGTFQHSSFRFPTLSQVFLDLFPINWRLTESRLNGRYPKSWDERPFEIDHPLGAFMCIRRAATQELGMGLFDEAFFMYAEEVDWCFRFKRAGWQVWHCPDALALHHGGQSTRQRAGEMFVQLHMSRLLLFHKHYPPWFAWTAQALLRVGMEARLRKPGTRGDSEQAAVYRRVMGL